MKDKTNNRVSDIYNFALNASRGGTVEKDKVLDLYDFALFMAEHIYDDVRNTTDDDRIESIRSLKFTIMNGISAFQMLEDEHGREYRIDISREQA